VLRICLALAFAIAGHAPATNHPNDFWVEVSGTITTLDEGTSLLVANAKLTFYYLDPLIPIGVAAETVANQDGKYSVLLSKDRSYAVTVSVRGFCTVYRPLFRTRANSPIKFDFSLSTDCRPSDYVFPRATPEDFDNPDFMFASSIPYFFQEYIRTGECMEKTWVIAFGKRVHENHVVRYAPLPVRRKPGVHYPVTISLSTYTVQSDTVALDQDAKTLRAEGHVTIADGTMSPPKQAECAILPMDFDHPQFLDCPAATPAHR
jgi:hypothetical protein